MMMRFDSNRLEHVMIEDDAPPNPLPPAAQSPYPDRTQHPPHDAPRLPAHVPEGPAIGALGITLIGGAIAAGLGLLIAIPLLRRKI